MPGDDGRVRTSLFMFGAVTSRASPYKAYKKLKIGKNKILVNIWGLNDKN